MLQGKNIAVIGRVGHTESELNILWHDGNKVDNALEQILAAADVCVLLVRYISHEVGLLPPSGILMRLSLYQFRSLDLSCQDLDSSLLPPSLSTSRLTP